MKALILAAGYATRLYPLTKYYPKPLLKVGNKPVIDYLVENLDSIKEIDEIIVVTNDRFFSIFKKWAKRKQKHKRIKVISDGTKCPDDKLGSVGDIHFVIEKEKIKSDLLVLGGDNLFDSSIGGLIKLYKNLKTAPVVGLYDVEKRDARHYGVVALNKCSRIVLFQEKSSRPKSTLAAMCLYLFPRNKLKMVARYMKSKSNKCDAAGLYIGWLSKQTPVYGYIFGGRWYDIGHHRVYSHAKKNFKQ